MKGKFEGNPDEQLAEYLHQLSMEGCDEDLGDVQDFGWYGLIFHVIKGNLSKGQSYIVHEDNYGFFDYTKYDSKSKALEDWAILEKEYDDFMKETE